jgi:hypothetical protein
MINKLLNKKEEKGTMNKHSQNSNTTNDEIKELKARLKKLKKELKRETKEEVKGRWRALPVGSYWYVHPNGEAKEEFDYSTDFDNECFNKGNYFKTQELVKKSLIDFALNDPYEYWLPWMGEDTKPSEVPDGLQYWNDNYWYNSVAKPSSWIRLSYRWPKHSNMELERIIKNG